MLRYEATPRVSAPLFVCELVVMGLQGEKKLTPDVNSTTLSSTCFIPSLFFFSAKRSAN